MGGGHFAFLVSLGQPGPCFPTSMALPLTIPHDVLTRPVPGLLPTPCTGLPAPAVGGSQARGPLRQGALLRLSSPSLFPSPELQKYSQCPKMEHVFLFAPVSLSAPHLVSELLQDTGKSCVSISHLQQQFHWTILSASLQPSGQALERPQDLGGRRKRLK